MIDNPLQLTTYGLYTIVSLTMTFWVGRTLFTHGRPFLIDAFRGEETLADAVNHLLIVGFYLVNLGYVSLSLAGGDPEDLAGAIETLSVKIGWVALVLGLIHFLNLFLISKFRQSGFGAGLTGHPREEQAIGSR